MLVKLCAKCKKVIQHPNTYCDICRPIALQEKEEIKQRTNTRYNKQRIKKYEQFYNSKQWRDLSKMYLHNHNYKCEDCIAKSTNQYHADVLTATECHHKIPIQTQEGWDLRLEESNLRALCHNHHDIRHKRFANKTKHRR